MDNRKILIILIFSIIGITIFSDMVNSCYLEPLICYTDDRCKSYYLGSCYEFWYDFGGCQMGFAIGQYYVKVGVDCYGPEAKWSTSGSNGQTCKLRWNSDCSGEFEGKYDSSTGTCVKCSGRIKTEEWYCAGGVGQKRERLIDVKVLVGRIVVVMMLLLIVMFILPHVKVFVILIVNLLLGV